MGQCIGEWVGAWVGGVSNALMFGGGMGGGWRSIGGEEPGHATITNKQYWYSSY